MGGFITRLLGGSSGDAVSGIAKIIDTFHLSPEEKIQAEQAKALLAQHSQEFKAGIELQYAQLDAADRASARERQSAVRDYVPGFLAVFTTLGFFGLLTVLLYHTIPTANEHVEYIMLGSLGTAWVSVVGYYFGSSSTATSHAGLIEDLARKSVE